MEVKAVIFDCDGVLVDSSKYHIQSWSIAFNKYNLFPSTEDLALLEGMSYTQTIDFISKQHKIKLSSEQKKQIYSIKTKTLMKLFQFDIYPNVYDLLLFLKEKNIKLGLVTGANKEFIVQILNKHFKNTFDFVITGDDVLNGKPNPEPYLKAISEIVYNIKDILVIENAPLGIKSAKDANLKTFALETTLNKKYLTKADKVFKSHYDLLNYFNKNI